MPQVCFWTNLVNAVQECGGAGGEIELVATSITTDGFSGQISLGGSLGTNGFNEESFFVELEPPTFEDLGYLETEGQGFIEGIPRVSPIYYATGGAGEAQNIYVTLKLRGRASVENWSSDVVNIDGDVLGEVDDLSINPVDSTEAVFTLAISLIEGRTRFIFMADEFDVEFIINSEFIIG